MSSQNSVDSFVKEAGCGPFQMMIAGWCYMMRMAVAHILLFIPFALYDPGWTCVFDNGSNSTVEQTNSSSTLVSTLTTNTTSKPGNCDLYPTCQKVEFKAGESTLVTEFELLCEDSMAVKRVIMLCQMVALLVGALLAGLVGDRFGRKFGCCLWVAIGGLGGAVGILSTSWKMFAGSRVLVGIGAGGNMVTHPVYLMEFIAPKWRVITLGIPSLDLGIVVLAVLSWIVKDWRYAQFGLVTLSIASLIVAMFIPESMRWLVVNGQPKKVHSVAEKIRKMNKLPRQEEKSLRLKTWDVDFPEPSSNFFDIFHRSLVVKTLSLGMIFMTTSCSYFSLTFGLGVLSGNFYLNFVIVGSVTFPTVLIAGFLGRKLGQRIAAICLYISLAIVCVVILIVFFTQEDPTRANVIRILTLGSFLHIEPVWSIFTVLANEIMPTVVRANASGFTGIAARSGGIVAALLVPSDFESLYVVIAFTGIFSVINICLLAYLPDTRYKPMPDTLGSDGGSRGKSTMTDAEATKELV